MTEVKQGPVKEPGTEYAALAANRPVVMNYDVPSLEVKVSDVEWQRRVDLAIVYRLIAHFGWDDVIFTHLSARIPGAENHFLLNPFDLMFKEVTVSSLVKVDVDGNPVEPTLFVTSPAAFAVHSAIHMALHDPQAVVHGGVICGWPLLECDHRRNAHTTTPPLWATDTKQGENLCSCRRKAEIFL